MPSNLEGSSFFGLDRMTSCWLMVPSWRELCFPPSILYRDVILTRPLSVLLEYHRDVSDCFERHWKVQTAAGSW